MERSDLNIPDQKHANGAVSSFFSANRLLQLREQCTILTYFPIIRMHTSGTRKKKELLKV
ncbi:hypothetical protein Clim_0538 [Chlorobium limicola DSM 245]|uniref:Uncharacterized protein n=1 Tax=Chlorobium limicola (strain DSM 245 / NBRC 103803 / 6330) TaxID=290315 RepID=B3EGJ3_CHLL2|nr:hypothetical protein Clim_0538 [Chlorobium limicola DSM 245]